MRRTTDNEKKALREQTVEPVKYIMSALISTGLNRTEAAKAVRWAAHILEHEEAPDGDD